MPSAMTNLLALISVNSPGTLALVTKEYFGIFVSLMCFKSFKHAYMLSKSRAEGWSKSYSFGSVPGGRLN